MIARVNKIVFSSLNAPRSILSFQVEPSLYNVHEPPQHTLNCRTIYTLNQHFRQSTMAQTTRTQSFNTGDNNTSCGNIISSFNNTFFKADEDAEIMHWLWSSISDIKVCALRNAVELGIGLRKQVRFGSGGGLTVEPIELSCLWNPRVGKRCLK